MILECERTGRFWRCRDVAHAHRLARRFGLVDYSINPRHRATTIGE